MVAWTRATVRWLEPRHLQNRPSEDLQTLRTFGFRGEALYAAAAV